MSGKDSIALLKCKNNCGNYKFAHDCCWDKVTNQETLDYFQKKAEKGDFIIYDHILCPDCTSIEVQIQSELQPGDIVQKSSIGMEFDE